MTDYPDELVVHPEEAPVFNGSEGRISLETRSGQWFQVRPARPDDLPALRLFLSRLTREDLRFRFLSAFRQVPADLAQALLRNDHRRTEHFLAFLPGGSAIVASAVVALDEAGEMAEVAICTHPDFKQLGLSWSLMQHVMDWAGRHGVDSVEVIEASDHRDAIALERELGFTVSSAAGSPGELRLFKRIRP